MKDMITAGTGNSRWLKSSIPDGTTWEQALELFRNGSFPIDFNGVNPDGITQEGTPLNSVTLLADQVAVNIGLPDTATPSEAIQALHDSKTRKAQMIALNVAVGDWTSTSTGYSYTITSSDITAYSLVLLNPDDSIANVADLSYTVAAGQVTLTTTLTPTGTLTGHLAILDDDTSGMSGLLKARSRLKITSILTATVASDTSITTLGGVRFSDFDLILFRWTTGAGSSLWTRDTRVAIVEPSGSFGASELSFVDSQNVQRWCGVQYVDATHATLTKSSNAAGTLYGYGLRLA